MLRAAGFSPHSTVLGDGAAVTDLLAKDLSAFDVVIMDANMVRGYIVDVLLHTPSPSSSLVLRFPFTALLPLGALLSDRIHFRAARLSVSTHAPSRAAGTPTASPRSSASEPSSRRRSSRASPLCSSPARRIRGSTRGTRRRARAALW